MTNEVSVCINPTMKIILLRNPDDGRVLLPEDLDSLKLVRHLLGDTVGVAGLVEILRYSVAISELPLLKFLAAAHNWAVQIPKELQ